MRTAIVACSTAALASIVPCGVASAAQQRSFVSTAGSDAANCTLAAPCRSFDAAIAQTLDNGEIVVLDSGGYGPVVVNKSVELVAPPGVYAGIAASAGTAIQVVSPAVKVAIRGIAINGLGSGQFGIDVQFGAEILVERCRIAHFAQDGVRMTTPSELTVRDTEIGDNVNNGVTLSDGVATLERVGLVRNGHDGANASGADLSVRDSAATRNGNDGIRVAGISTVAIIGSEIARNARYGVFADGSVASSTLDVAIDRTTLASNQTTGVAYNVTAAGALVNVAVARSLFSDNFSGVSGGGTGSKVVVTDSVFERNIQTAMAVSGTGAELTVSRNVVTGSANGIAKFSGGVVYTRADNAVRGNTNDVQNGPFTSFGGT